MTWKLDGVAATNEELAAMRADLGVTDGQDGTFWFSGNGVPVDGSADDGDFYLDRLTADVYVQIAGAWSLALNIKGNDGADGTNGTNGANGTNGTNGRGITSIARTSGNGAAGTTDTYTITFTDATSTTFTVVNGTNGTNGTNGLPGIVISDTAPVNTNVLWADTSTSGAGLGPLPVVAITNAAVSMVANRRYQGSIADFTADRTYTLPAGTAGDIIEVALTTGDDAFELIIAGASGVSINGGSAATEWSRLFIDNEFVRFRCLATNDWRVEVDERIPQVGVLVATSSSSVPSSTWTQVLFNTESSNSSSASHANDRLIARRAGIYNLSAFWLSDTNAVTSILSITRNGATTSPDRRIVSNVIAGSSSGIGNFTGGDLASNAVTAAAGDTFELLVFLAGISATAMNSVPYQPRFAFTEVL